MMPTSHNVKIVRALCACKWAHPKPFPNNTVIPPIRKLSIESFANRILKEKSMQPGEKYKNLARFSTIKRYVSARCGFQ